MGRAQPDRDHARRVPNDPFAGEEYWFHNTGQVNGGPRRRRPGRRRRRPRGLGDHPRQPRGDGRRGRRRRRVRQPRPGVRDLDQPGRERAAGGSRTAWTTTATASSTTGAAGTGATTTTTRATSGCFPHGTAVAGIIGARADDGYGVAGVAPLTRIMPLRINSPSGAATISDVVAAFGYAQRMGARVVNASFGGTTASSAERAAIAAAPGVLFVTSAGNDGRDMDAGGPNYPCAFDLPNVICVAATDERDRLAGFSNRGATTVDLAAPGRRGADHRAALRRARHRGLRDAARGPVDHGRDRRHLAAHDRAGRERRVERRRLAGGAVRERREPLAAARGARRT